MDGGGAEDGEGAAEESQCAAAEGSDLGAPADPAMASLGDGGGPEGSGQRAATVAEGRVSARLWQEAVSRLQQSRARAGHGLRAQPPTWLEAQAKVWLVRARQQL